MTSYTVINPATEQPVTAGRHTTAERPTRPSSARPGRSSPGASVAPGDRARLLRRFAEQVDAHIDELAALETAARAIRPAGRLGSRPGARRPRLLRRGAGTADRQADPRSRRSGRDVQGATRRRRPHRAVELPDADPVLGPRAGPRGRLPRRRQARGDDAADRDADRRAGPGGRAARGRVPGAAGQGQRRRPAAGRSPGRAQDRVHRLHRGRAADHGRLRPAHQAADARARRQEREHRLRRRRHREGRGHGAVRRVRQRRAGLLRPLADPRAGQRHEEFMARLETAVSGVRVGDPAAEGTEMGPLISAAHRDARGQLRARRRAGRVPRHRAGRPRLLVPADRAGAGRRATRLPIPRRSSARSSR